MLIRGHSTILFLAPLPFSVSVSETFCLRLNLLNLIFKLDFVSRISCDVASVSLPQNVVECPPYPIWINYCLDVPFVPPPFRTQPTELTSSTQHSSHHLCPAASQIEPLLETILDKNLWSLSPWRTLAWPHSLSGRQRPAGVGPCRL